MLRGVPQGGKGGAVLIPYIVSQDDKGGWYDYSPSLYCKCQAEVGFQVINVDSCCAVEAALQHKALKERDSSQEPTML